MKFMKALLFLLALLPLPAFAGAESAALPEAQPGASRPAENSAMPPETPAEKSEALPEKGGAAREGGMTVFDGAILGVVEGFTEFLPISSTGHLIVANEMLGLNSDAPAVYSNGEAISAGGKSYTVKDAACAYTIIIQIAAIIAVVFVYWNDVASMLLGFLGRDRMGLLKLRNLIVAFVPAAVSGLLLHKVIETRLFSTGAVVFALVAGAFAMFWAQKKYSKELCAARRAVQLHELSIKDSFIVGLFQCLALWPGTSRSMATIVGAYVVGLRPVEAAKFSFLLGLITLSAASVFTLCKDGGNMFAALPLAPRAAGFVVAFICSLLSAKWLVGFLNRRGLAPFAWYRILLAAVLCAFFI